MSLTAWPLLGRAPRVDAPADAFASIERRVAGRLGVAMLDTATGRRASHRAGERFPMCSTFKLVLVGAVLSRVDAGRERLERDIPYGAADLLAYAPVTRAHAAAGKMSVSALCAAALRYSDNTAANLLLAALGGPPGVTRYARAIGDGTTRLDRTEPSLNSAIPGDPRDTTTPAAMLDTLHALTLGAALTPTSRRRLADWLMGNTTGDAKLRAGLPHGWRVGDKTGSGGFGSTNDVAIAWPPGRAPILIAAYLTQTRAAEADRDAALADVGRAAAAL